MDMAVVRIHDTANTLAERCPSISWMLALKIPATKLRGRKMKARFVKRRTLSVWLMPWRLSSSWTYAKNVEVIFSARQRASWDSSEISSNLVLSLFYWCLLSRRLGLTRWHCGIHIQLLHREIHMLYRTTQSNLSSGNIHCQRIRLFPDSLSVVNVTLLLIVIEFVDCIVRLFWRLFLQYLE